MNNSLRLFARLGLLLLLLLGSAARADSKDQTERAEAAFRNGDLITAMGLLRQAADAGYAPAQARLADLLDAAEQDVEAVALYRKAAAQNDPAGELGLGRMLAQGDGVARDIEQGLALIRRAAEKDHVPAIDALARATRAGAFGLKRDPIEADRLEQRMKALREAAKVKQ